MNNLHDSVERWLVQDGRSVTETKTDDNFKIIIKNIDAFGNDLEIFEPAAIRTKIEQYASAEISAKVFAKCPACSKSSSTRENVDKEFGFRNIDGIIRPQSWCRACRKLQTKTA